MIAESPTAARSSPHLEAFNERGIEVLLLTDRLDEWVMQHLTEYGGKPCKDVRRGALDLPRRGRRREEARSPDRERQALLKRVKQVLRERVDEVRVGGRLRQSAACLVLSEHDLGYQMRELLAAAGHQAPAAVPSLELNPEHALVRRLDRETDPARFERLAAAAVRAGRARRGPAARRSGGVRRAAQRAPRRSRRRRAARDASAADDERQATTGVEIPGPAGVLEAAIDASARARALRRPSICHPHPLQQGTMSNKVVTTLARAFTRLGADAVRFNFRGVGGLGRHAMRTASASATTRSPSSRGAARAGLLGASISAASRSAPRSRRRSPRASRPPAS